MAFLFQDQNQGIRNDAPREMRLSRPFSFIRTLTVGFGIAPNLLTLLRFYEEGARGLGLLRPYRRWGLSPRPENISRPVEQPEGNYARAPARQQASLSWQMRMSAMRLGRDFTDMIVLVVSRINLCGKSGAPIPFCSNR